MRISGVTRAADGFGPHDHVCWAYDEGADFRGRAAEFLADGVAQGLRTSLIAPGDPEQLRAGLRRSGVLADALRDGSLTVQSVEGVYGAEDVVDPETQAGVYAAATGAALADGFRGYRIVAEATALVRTPEQLAQFTRYEHRVDRLMAERPFSAMCAYHRPSLGAEAVALLASLHPASSPGTSPFRLHTASDGTLTLSGELDHLTARTFPLALERAEPAGQSGELVIDGTGLEFVDHRNLYALADLAAREELTVVLRTAWPGARRLVELLGIEGVTVERVA
ncbi:MEDS domain-containing protein [Amycolatopsis acidiphila]|uniref:STAS domain-containing protein n=1 Tax=Amycolatopsis acidiphila TaxID=715473 RepID=A0A557ZZ45_9PSEU|nr:MEDS domain-containing protein [Amycolatopsis acidiphila]TVT17286.1 STAS domain-containing protein [Amycolatopsis acidiphila]UIJ61473.1 MEDS domain-containing protein [Amycolatopsis acidiphila]